MGYSHYFYQKRSMTPGEFELFKQDIDKLSQTLTDLVGQSINFEKRYGSREPGRPNAVHPGNVVAHGPGLVAGGALVGVDVVGFCEASNPGCEAFFVSRELRGYVDKYHLADIDRDGQRVYGIKTRHRPYDTMVCATLLCLMERAPDAWRVSSDGSVEEWGAPARFASSVLARPMPLDLIGNFAAYAERLKTALAPTAWMVSNAERPEIKKIAGATVKKRNRHAL